MLKAVLLLILTCNFASAQQGKYFPPLNIPLRLAGTFCEVRTDHFHSGIDLKTMGREGLPVFAADDGYIYRVKVSSSGYGKAIYIMHSDSMLSVYGHLHSFYGPVADSIEAYQYSKKSFEAEFFPETNRFPVKRGQQIGWSGNSGGSEAPHLHFELRDQRKEEPLNPLIYALNIIDTIPPEIEALKLFELNNGVVINDRIYKTDSLINRSDTLYIDADTCLIAFSGFDEMNDSLPSSLGIYSSILSANGNVVYQYRFLKMNFEETRFVNAHIDYYERKTSGIEFQRCYTLPGNKFNAFKDAGTGYVLLNDEKPVKVVLTVADATGNNSRVSFYVKKKLRKIKPVASASVIRYPNKVINRKWNTGSVTFPTEAFYETVSDVEVKHSINKKSKLTEVRLMPNTTVLNKPCIVKLKVPQSYIPFADKILIVSFNDKNKVLRPMGGGSENGYVVGHLKQFGNYTLAIDTTPPEILQTGFITDSVFNQHWIQVKLRDNLSGIKSYSGMINEEWALFEYDAKTGTLSYRLRNENGPVNLYIEVSDQKNNLLRYSEAIELSLPVITK